MVRTGGSFIGLGLVVGVGFTGFFEQAFPSDDGPFVFLVAGTVMSPLLLTGLITAGRGARLRARARRLTASVQLAGGRYGFSLAGHF